MKDLQNMSHTEIIEKAKEARSQAISKGVSSVIQSTRKYAEEVTELPFPYWPLIIGGGVIGVVVGWTVLIWMPGSTVAIPIALTHWAKKREEEKKTKK